MKVNIRFRSRVMRDNDLFARCVRALSDVAIAVNRQHLRRFKTPALYDANVRWKNEPQGLPDEITDIPSIIARGHGDCWHLCCWRVAELLEAGEAATIRVIGRTIPQKKTRLFHVQVRRADGTVEDPSRVLGMKISEG